MNRIAAWSAAAFCIAACGGSDGSSFQDPATAVDGTNGPGALGAGADGGGGVSRPLSACVTSTAAGQALPAHLVFMYDKSGSMRDDSKWSSCASAMSSFFGAAETTGMKASLAFFSQNDSCDDALYAKPSVAMRALPDSSAFGSAIAAEGPSGKTPTLPAMKGAITYAKQIEQGLAGAGRVAIVLVTDGIPNGCASTPESAGAVAATVAATIPTYVIGVGDALQNLDVIAQGGGTKKAILVSTANPAQVTADLAKALGDVKQALGCEYTVPAAPAGQTLDYGAVNVVLTPASGAPVTLDYSSDCKNGSGWHYDTPSAPTRIVMCKQSCDSLLAQAATSKVEIELGCVTQGEPPR